jgi:hypothetical protein
MRFNDLMANQNDIDEEEDPEVALFSDLRRKRITLEHVNRLRKIRDLRKYEDKQRLQLVKKMYARPTEAL